MNYPALAHAEAMVHQRVGNWRSGRTWLDWLPQRSGQARLALTRPDGSRGLRQLALFSNTNQGEGSALIRSLIAIALLASVANAAAAADPVAGQKVFKTQCASCHSPVAGKKLVGPSLFGVVGRKAGSVPGFRYSSANQKFGETWDAATLDTYLTKPRDVVPGTSMTYAGLKNVAQRADLIAYLETLH
jgi:cytochrome c